MMKFIIINFTGSDHSTIIAIRRIDQVSAGKDGGSIMFLDGDIQGKAINEAYRYMIDELMLNAEDGRLDQLEAKRGRKYYTAPSRSPAELNARRAGEEYDA